MNRPALAYLNTLRSDLQHTPLDLQHTPLNFDMLELMEFSCSTAGTLLAGSIPVAGVRRLLSQNGHVRHCRGRAEYTPHFRV